MNFSLNYSSDSYMIGARSFTHSFVRSFTECVVKMGLLIIKRTPDGDFGTQTVQCPSCTAHFPKWINYVEEYGAILLMGSIWMRLNFRTGQPAKAAQHLGVEWIRAGKKHSQHTTTIAQFQLTLCAHTSITRKSKWRACRDVMATLSLWVNVIPSALYASAIRKTINE